MLILTQNGRLVVNTAYVFEIGIRPTDSDRYAVTATIHTGNLANVQFEDLGTYSTEEIAMGVLDSMTRSAMNGEQGFFMS